uniref:RING-type domain-containing protein n=1 Tax=Naja naja TaxID=35670 RepID=A0A8C6VCZ9_NAJNA
MAASGDETLEGQLGQEATCPLCLDFFEQPMVLSCGHNFCRHCLAQLGPEASCPQCRAKVETGSACPNRALANVVHLVKRRRFCSREKSLLCPGCLEGHQGHPLLSLPEAAQQYKVGTNSLGFSIRHRGPPKSPERWEELSSLLPRGRRWGWRWSPCRSCSGRQRSGWAGWLSRRRRWRRRGWLWPSSREASRLQQLMAQMERKCRQPDAEFLQVGGPSLASRGEGRPATLARAAPISLFFSFRTSRTP